jgi:uncharacterized protein (TIGR03437 family)
VRIPELVSFCLLSFFFLSSIEAADWPMYLGNLAHSSVATAETQLTPGNIGQLQQLWKINVGAPVASGVTTANGSLFFGAWDGNFYAVDAATGNVLWKTFLGIAAPPNGTDCQPAIGISSQPVATADTVYAGGGDAAVYALDRSSGAIRWRTPLADSQSGAYVWSSIMLSNRALYVGVSSLGDCPLVRGGLARISLDDPAHPLVRYFVPPGRLGAGVWSTPAIDEQANLVYVTTGNADSQDANAGIWGSTLLALDATTLAIRAHFFRPVASFDNDGDWGSSPTLLQTSDGKQFVAANGKDGVMYVLSRPDLSLAWSYKLATLGDAPQDGGGSISTPAFDGQTIFVGGGTSDASNSSPGVVYALDPLTHNARWTYPARGPVLAPVTVTPYLVLVASMNGLSILDAATGIELWTDQGTAGLYGQTVVANSAIYAAYVNGDVSAWDWQGNGSPGLLSASPGNLIFSYTVSGAAPAAQPIHIFSSSDAVQFVVSSDSPWLAADQQAGSTTATISIGANAAGMAPGSYAGSILVTSGDSTTSATIGVKLIVNGPLPALTSANVGNAASFQTNALAPGSLFSIIAPNLGSDTASPATSPWPTALDGISVSINGIRAPLVYAGSNQINGQVPFEVPVGPATWVVQSNGVSTPPAIVNITAAAPGIFLLDGGRAAALNQDFSVNRPDNPAAVGSVVAVYWTGQGLVDNPIATGAAAPAMFLNTTVAPTTATIGGQTATVLYSGLAPGFVGLAQANLQVPDLDPGDYPVVLTVGDAVSNAAIVSAGRP